MLAKASGWILAATVYGCLVSGCETSRTKKVHGPMTVTADITTTGKQDPNITGNGEGQPPVPGSPTAAGVDGKQPYDDAMARSGPGAEHGEATQPSVQPKDSFQQQ